MPLDLIEVITILREREGRDNDPQSISRESLLILLRAGEALIELRANINRKKDGRFESNWIADTTFNLSPNAANTLAKIPGPKEFDPDEFM